MPEERNTADRMAAYSDAFFAIIVTVMVLELRVPDEASWSALALFGPPAATPCAFVAPRVGFGLICGALVLHLRPEVPGHRG